MKKIFIVLATLLFTVSAYAQQDLLMTQQFFSRINKNPAGIGTFEQIDACLLGRFQWVDIKDSPKSSIFNVQPFKTELNSGFGFTMSYDDIGPAKGSFNPKAVYACLNFNEAFCPEQISDRSICINGDIFDILMAISSI